MHGHVNGQSAHDESFLQKDVGSLMLVVSSELWIGSEGLTNAMA